MKNALLPFPSKFRHAKKGNKDVKETQFWGYGSVGADCTLAPTVAATTAEGGTLTRELAIFGNVVFGHKFIPASFPISSVAWKQVG